MRDVCWEFVKETLKDDESFLGDESLYKYARAQELYRFMQARDFNVPKAIEMYQ
jgi:hypothetical protein